VAYWLLFDAIGSRGLLWLGILPAFVMPMLISTMVTATSVVIALLISPETKGKVFVSDLMRH
jgi:hypothetical protein